MKNKLVVFKLGKLEKGRFTNISAVDPILSVSFHHADISVLEGISYTIFKKENEVTISSDSDKEGVIAVCTVSIKERTVEEFQKF